jgi:hypothetical protein
LGKDTLLTGRPSTAFRVHMMRVCWPGVISRFSVAPANAHELCVLPELAESTSGLLVGDRNYYSLKTFLAPYSSKTRPGSQKECLPHPASLPDRHGLFAAQQALLDKAGVGA